MEERVEQHCGRIEELEKTVNWLEQAQNDLKVEVKVLVARVSVWAALGSLIGGAVVTAVVKVIWK